MDYERLAYCCRERSKREMEDATQITLEEAATAITDLLASAEAAEAEKQKLCEEADHLKDLLKEADARCNRLDEARERANEAAHKWESRCKMLEERAEKAEKERDAAINSWRGFCIKCTWNGKQYLSDGKMDDRCKTCRENGKCNWEWRGQKKD